MIFYEFWAIMLLALGVVAVMLLEYFGQRKVQPYVAVGAVATSALTIVYYLVTDGTPQFFGLEAASPNGFDATKLDYGDSVLVLDKFTGFFALLFLGVMFFVLLSSVEDLKQEEDESNHFVYYVLMLMTTIGMILVSSAIDLATLIVSWEMVSIPSYILVAYMKRQRVATEAAVKFFIVGAVSSALMLFGASFLYGISGSTNIYVLMDDITGLTDGDVIQAINPLIIVGLIFVVAGLGFKMGVVPFQWWLPDTYEGALTSVTAMLAAASKKVGFAAGFRVLTIPLIVFGGTWATNNPNAQEAVFYLLLIVAMATMVVGNVGALNQTRMKRLLAYSSIGQAGYILLAVASATVNSQNESSGLFAGLFHSFTHAVAAMGAFIAVLAIYQLLQSDEIDDYKGLVKVYPRTALALTIMLLSLAGIPPMIGLVSKIFIFLAAFEAGNTLPPSEVFYLAAFIMVVTSTISVYYYIRVVKYMLVDEPSQSLLDRFGETKPTLPLTVAVPIAVSAIILLTSLVGIGFIQDFLYDVTRSVVEPLINT